jgi:hypothetical protein
MLNLVFEPEWVSPTTKNLIGCSLLLVLELDIPRNPRAKQEYGIRSLDVPRGLGVFSHDCLAPPNIKGWFGANLGYWLLS